MIGSQVSFAESRNPNDGGITQSVKGVAERVQRDIQDWTVGSNEGIARVKAEIRDKFGLNVECDRGYVGLWGSLSKADCVSGLTRLASGLSEVPLNVDRSYLADVKIELGAPGLWQGLTIMNRDMKIPFNANPKIQASFIADEVALLYRINLKQLAERNAEYAKKISDKYFILVDKDPTVDVYQYHDGLKKAALTATLIYAGQKPTRELAQSLGFDRLIVSKANSGLEEENGELQISFNYADHPGTIFNYILKSVRNHNGSWLSRMTSSSKSWGQVVQFRRDRIRANELKSTLSQSLNKGVDCLLDSEQKGYVDMAECRAGLEKIKMALVTTTPRLGDDVNQILITNMTLNNYDFDPQSRSILIDYNANSAKIAEALGHK